MGTADVIVRPDMPTIGGAREAAVRRGPKQADGLVVGANADSRTYSGEDRYRMIAEAAYYRAEMRSFEAGNELEDWLAAEVEVDELLGDTGPLASA